MTLKLPILIVDDEPDILKILEEVLQEDYEVILAEGSAQAIEAMIKKPPHVILSDVNMPEVNGIEMLRKIRTFEPDIPVIFLTGHGDKDLVIQAMDAGGYGFIEKPADEDEILLAIKQAAHHHQLIKNNHDHNRQLMRKNISLKKLQNLLTETKKDASKSRHLAHEIRNPLTVVSGMVRLIRADLTKATVDFEAVNTKLDKIEKAITRSTTIIQETLRSSGQEAIFSLTNMVDLVEDCWLQFEGLDSTKSLKFQLSSSHPNIHIQCQSIQISQVLTNLIKNAIEAQAECESPWIKVTLNLNHQSVDLMVSDGGPGVDQDVMASIFKEGFTTKGQDGNGIGLFLSKKIVEEVHGGSMSYDTSPPYSCFKVNLPIEQQIQLKQPQKKDAA